MIEIISAVLMLIGVLFMCLAALGILRMPDLFLRLSTTTKAATLGVGSVLLAIAVRFEDVGVASRALAPLVFLLLTAPIAAHMIGRAAYFVGVPLCQATVLDQLRGRYDRLTHGLSSIRLTDLGLTLPDLHLYELPITEQSPAAGRTLAEIDLRRKYGVTLLGVHRGASVLCNPGGDVDLLAGDQVIVVGEPEAVERAAALFAKPGTVRPLDD